MDYLKSNLYKVVKSGHERVGFLAKVSAKHIPEFLIQDFIGQ